MIALAAPVDRVEIQVLVDNVTDSLSSAPAYVTNEWPNLWKAGLRRLNGACLCCANHGLALIVTAHRDGVSHTVMFDGGPAEYALEDNGTKLGIDFGGIKAMVLSHGHWDHAGGLPRALKLVYAANGGREIPLYLHPGMFDERAAQMPGGMRMPFRNVPTAEAFAALGAKPVVTDQPQSFLNDMFYVSGEIPRVTPYETGFPGHVKRSADGAWLPDPLIMDERFLAVNIKGKGVFVFSACSHAGIVNVLTHARNCFPDVPLFGAMGGFHLVGPNERIIPETVRDIGNFNLKLVAPGHCTGWRAVGALDRAFGDQIVVPIAVGKSFDL